MGVIQGSQDNSHDQPLQRCEGLQHQIFFEITLLMSVYAVILEQDADSSNPLSRPPHLVRTKPSPSCRLVRDLASCRAKHTATVSQTLSLTALCTMSVQHADVSAAI